MLLLLFLLQRVDALIEVLESVPISDICEHVAQLNDTHACFLARTRLLTNLLNVIFLVKLHLVVALIFSDVD